MNFICLGLSLLFFTLNTKEISANVITLGSYNVENLFDAHHDKENGVDKDDWSFLPKSAPQKKEGCDKEKTRHSRQKCLAIDWNESIVDLKINQIKEILTKERALPDFLGVQEVENEKVVALLAKRLGYTAFEMTKSLDRRGIDVALLFKKTKDIKMIARKEHIVPVEFATRNILEVEFLINGHYSLTLFVNHWPSLANPDSWRIKAAEILMTRSGQIMKKNSLMNIVAMGDFNTIDGNERGEPHPFDSVLYRNHFFTDAADWTKKKSGGKRNFLGSYYYSPKDQWSLLDHFFLNQNLLDLKGLDFNEKSFEIYSPHFAEKEIIKKEDHYFQKNMKIVHAPMPFNPKGKIKSASGYSDHFPIFITLNYPHLSRVKKK